MISIRKVSVQVLHSKTPIVSDISFELASGRLLGVYGPNGSGKSTLLRAVSGVSSHLVSGEVWVGAKRIWGEGRSPLLAQERVQEVLYIGSDYPCPFEVTVQDLFEIAISPVQGFKTNENWMNQVVDDFQLQPYLERSIQSLSEGEKQWVMFARALIQTPRILVLDEAFSKLDLIRSIEAARLLKKYASNAQAPITPIVASHDPDFLSEACDEMLLIQSGRLLKYGSRSDVLLSPEFKSLYAGLDLHVVMSPNSGRERILY